MNEEPVVDQSITAALKAYLEQQVEDGKLPQIIAGDTSSILHRASEVGLTLQQYVKADPDKALKEAEKSLSEWLNIQSTAAVEGYLATTDGKYMVNKNMTKLISDRVTMASQQLKEVNELVYTTTIDGERKKDHLLRTAYNRAVYNGDTRMLIYLIDRVEGRPGESKVVDLDYDNAFNVYQIIHTLFDKQLEVLNSGVGTKLICCTRRAGKTTLFSALVLIEALRTPNTTCIYIGTTMEQTELLVDQAINQIVDKCKLRDKRGKRLNWKHLDNGSKIIVRGLSNTKDPDLIRGNKAVVIVIDEFFHLKDDLLNYLVLEVLKPMQMDYADKYKFICGGTPPPIKATYGEHAWKTWEVPHFIWSWEDNPHPIDPKLKREYIENEIKEMGLDWSSPKIRREYLGEWCYDDDLLLYPEYHTYDPRAAVPNFNIDQVLFGIDYGVGDHDTLIGIAWDNAARRGYEFLNEKFNRLDIKDRTISQLQYLEQCITRAWELALEFFPHLEPKEANKRILWDADDNNQHITDHFNMNLRLPNYPTLRLNIDNAHKTDKIMMFDKIRDLLRTANLLLMKDSKTALECEKTVLRRGPNGQVYPEVDMKIFHPDLLPALRYALWNVVGQEAAPKNV